MALSSWTWQPGETLQESPGVEALPEQTVPAPRALGGPCAAPLLAKDPPAETLDRAHLHASRRPPLPAPHVQARSPGPPASAPQGALRKQPDPSAPSLKVPNRRASPGLAGHVRRCLTGGDAVTSLLCWEQMRGNGTRSTSLHGSKDAQRQAAPDRHGGPHGAAPWTGGQQLRGQRLTWSPERRWAQSEAGLPDPWATWSTADAAHAAPAGSWRPVQARLTRRRPHFLPGGPAGGNGPLDASLGPASNLQGQSQPGPVTSAAGLPREGPRGVSPPDALPFPGAAPALAGTVAHLSPLTGRQAKPWPHFLDSTGGRLPA